MSAQAKSPKILLVRLSSLGDVIQTLPLPTVIRQSFPQTEIGWAIDTELVPAIEGHPHIDYIHRCDRNRWARAALNPLRWPRVVQEMGRFIGEIRAVGYDLAIDAQGLFRSAVIPFFARIERRVGFAHRRELTNFFYNERHVSKGEYFDPDRHHTDHMLALASAIGCETANYRIHLPEVDLQCREKVASLLDGAFAGPRALVAIAPGTQWSSKRWPSEYWLGLMQRMLAETDTNLILIASKSDAPLTKSLMDRLGDAARRRVRDLAGRTSLPELYVLLSRASVTIAADTAPLQVAGAAGCPHVIGLFGATPRTRTGPIGSSNMALLSAEPELHCQPCQRRVCRYGTNECMRRISPDDVFAALRKALATLQNCSSAQPPEPASP